MGWGRKERIKPLGEQTKNPAGTDKRRHIGLIQRALFKIALHQSLVTHGKVFSKLILIRAEIHALRAQPLLQALHQRRPVADRQVHLRHKNKDRHFIALQQRQQL